MYGMINMDDMISFKDTHFRMDRVATFGPVMAQGDKWLFKITFNREEYKPLVFRAKDREDAAQMSNDLYQAMKTQVALIREQRNTREEADRVARNAGRKMSMFDIAASAGDCETISN